MGNHYHPKDEDEADRREATLKRKAEFPGGELVVNEITIGAYYRHKKTGGVYQVLMFATIEATMTLAVVYAAKRGGEVQRWVRPVDEFVDGRFEPVDMTPTDH